MDVVVIAARLLLVVGCSAAALMPARLAPSDGFIADQPEPVSVTALTRPVSAAVARSPLPADDFAPFVISSQLGFEAGSRSVVASEPPDVSPSAAEPVSSTPVWVRIPSQGIDARVVPVGVTPTGEMETPAGYDEVGWYRHGARPGEPGRAVLAGHLDSRDGPAVFFQLGSLQPGDTIEVRFSDGVEPLMFTVRELAQYSVDGAPLSDIFGSLDRPELVLITCAGDFQGPESGYSERVIVYADVGTGS